MTEETKSPMDQVIDKVAADPGFRDRLVADPKPTLKRELGIVFPDNVDVVVVQNTLDKFTVVLPVDQLDFDELGEVVGLDAVKNPGYHNADFSRNYVISPRIPKLPDTGIGDVRPKMP